MLQELTIRNFAIIDDLNISFPGDLTVLSGETGAGKSIILNAVNLLLGSRANTTLIRTGAEVAELEALFQIAPKSDVANIMEQHGYDASEGLLVRRLISRNDNNRIYINGRLSTMQILNSITENLASISGQHAHQGLLKEDQHLLILDQFGGLMFLREEVFQCFHQILPIIEKLKNLISTKEKQAERIELLEFQKKEITEASMVLAEDAALEKELTILKNGEELYQAVNGSIEELYSAQGSIVERLVEVKKNLEKAGRIDSQLTLKAEGVAGVTFNLEDMVENLRTYLKTIQIDEKRLEAVEDRIDTLQRLKRKYGGSIEAVLKHLDSISQELFGIENISGTIADTEKELSMLHKKFVQLAETLSDKRNEKAKILAKKVVTELDYLEMSSTRFQISLKNTPADEKANSYLTVNGNLLTETGLDRATFLIAPNIGEALKPLASIASGGELSRVVLAMKAILAETDSVETVVFDEVDAGIGGSVAEVVGKKLSSLADHHQVICITHLPQIAKFANQHFCISKSVSDGRTSTSINPLNEKDRLKEIARMLGGVEITQATLDHAREMLETAI
ncbi:MAG: DNA repair protein RecN [Desulfobacterales bacterium]|nr:DNA repair protein RecN [Desulfobacterales bacterium]MDX2510083.1 DNA repair protein RecN [Desulfobacterales bacterium]